MYKITETQFKKMPPELQKLYEKLPNRSSDEVVGLFPDGRSAGSPSHTNKKYKAGDTSLFHGQSSTYFTDSGSASRFFYCAKASKSERNKGLEGVFTLNDNVSQDNINEIRHLLSI